ncbi:MAG: YciI family protein [Sphingomonas fennica]
MAPLCVVALDYVAPLAELDAAMDDHVAWLEAGYAEGVILASGRKVPRTGGIILFRGAADAVEPLVATDPFVARGLATAAVTPFVASMAAPALADLLA